jgi:Domain of unknown function (DUF397)
MKYRKSSYSNSNSNCVEVGAKPKVVAVRDTKEKGFGPVLSFSPKAWTNFINSLKNLSRKQVAGRFR